MKVFPATTAAVLICSHLAMAQAPEVWTFDRLDAIGGHPTTVLGSPRLIDTPLGKAVEFNGVDSALVVDVHPLAGAATYTWEAIFRPDGGEQAQRWLHLQENGTENRMLFELRIVDNQWYFDSFVYSGTSSKALSIRSVFTRWARGITWRESTTAGNSETTSTVCRKARPRSTSIPRDPAAHRL